MKKIPIGTIGAMPIERSPADRVGCTNEYGVGCRSDDDIVRGLGHGRIAARVDRERVGYLIAVRIRRLADDRGRQEQDRDYIFKRRQGR